MQLVYNGGLCGRTEGACLMPSEVQVGSSAEGACWGNDLDRNC